MRERPPIAFRYPDDPERRLSGLAVDLAEKLGQAMDRRCVFTEGNRDELLDMLAKGNIDYICGLPQPLVPDGARVQTLDNQFRHKSPYSRRKLRHLYKFGTGL